MYGGILGGLTYGTGGDGANVYVCLPAGGVQVGGTAAVQFVRSLYIHQPDGGMVVSGAAEAFREWLPTISGGVSIAGDAPSEKLPFSHVPSGGLAIHGGASVIREWRPELSGGLTVAGASFAFKSWAVTPTVLRMEHAAYLRLTGYAYGSREGYRSSTWHDGIMIELPQPAESLRDDVGVQSGNTLAIPVAATDIKTTLESGSLNGTAAVVDLVTTRHFSNGSQSDHVTTRSYVVSGYSYRYGAVTLRLVGIDDARLAATYPARTFTADHWPEIFAEHIGRTVPVAVGTAVKIPCALVVTNAGAGPWVFAGCETPATILTVYRGGRVVSPSEYTTGTATVGGYTVVTVTFAQEQVDFSGGLYTIEIDVTGANPRNAVTEIRRLLLEAGASIDTTTFNDAITYAASVAMWSDFAHTEPREYRALLFDLLRLCRASLRLTEAGAYAIIQDRETDTAYTYDESAGDLIDVQEYESAEAPAAYTMAYRPNIAAPDKLQHVISRIAGGVTGTEHIDAAIVRDHETADRLLDYLAKRVTYGATARATVYADGLELGQVLSITSPVWSGAKAWRVDQITRGAGRADVSLTQYDATVYTYTPGTYPADAETGYSPDYSQTPPAAPTAVQVVSQGVALNQDGVAQSYALVKSTPPAVNWKEVWFQATNQSTNEIYQAVGTSNGDGTYGAKLAGLRPNVSHTLVSWAVNAYNVKGVVSGGVGFTSTPWTNAPGVPYGLSCQQGTGKLVQVNWYAASGTNIRGYEVSRSVNGGGYSVVAEVTGTTYPDNAVNYGSSYTYRLRTVDRAGNYSSNSGTAAITPSVNVGTGDVVDGAVTTPKRQNVNRVYLYATFPVGISNHTFVTFLGKTAVSVIGSADNNLAVWVKQNDANYIYVGGYNFSAAPISVYMTCDYW